MKPVYTWLKPPKRGFRKWHESNLNRRQLKQRLKSYENTYLKYMLNGDFARAKKYQSKIKTVEYYLKIKTL